MHDRRRRARDARTRNTCATTRAESERRSHRRNSRARAEHPREPAPRECACFTFHVVTSSFSYRHFVRVILVGEVLSQRRGCYHKTITVEIFRSRREWRGSNPAFFTEEDANTY